MGIERGNALLLHDREQIVPLLVGQPAARTDAMRLVLEDVRRHARRADGGTRRQRRPARIPGVARRATRLRRARAAPTRRRTRAGGTNTGAARSPRANRRT